MSRLLRRRVKVPGGLLIVMSREKPTLSGDHRGGESDGWWFGLTVWEMDPDFRIVAFMPEGA